MPDPVNFAMLILRIGLGAVFLAHGIKHARGRAKTTAWFASLGFRSPAFQWFASTATEIAVGALLLVGLGTSLAAAGVVGVMAVAYWTVHRTAGFFITAFMADGVDVEGWEYVFVLAAAAASLAVAGPGELSLDWVITPGESSLAEVFDGWVGAVLVLGGLLAAGVQVAAFWRPASVE